MYKEMKRMIISLVLSILLLTGETICVSAENIETIPFSMGQTLSGTVAENGTVYYQFSLSGKKTITLDATLTGGTIDLKIKDYISSWKEYLSDMNLNVGMRKIMMSISIFL